MKRGDGWYRIQNAASGPARVDIYDEIGADPWGGGVSASAFAADLAKVEGDVEVHINSPGGNVFDGLAIYNALASRPGNVTTVVDGLAASAASFVAQAGRSRVISPGAMVMIHDAQGMALGDAATMRETADLLDKASGNLAGIYAAHTGRPAGGWRDAMRAETWYTADEAVEAGLADRLAERPAAKSAAALAAKWAAELRNVAPREDGAPAPAAPPEALTGEEITAVRQLLNAAVDESAWDGPAAMSAASKADDPAAALSAICAGKRDGDPATQAAHALPHHKHQGDPPNRAGVSAALGRIGGTQGLTNKAAAQAHLEAHRGAMGSGSTDDHADLMPAWLTKALTAKEAAGQ
ncbi:MAG TPA: head maturation protease, ClpP-related [Streptosporangiaceae bacterium]